MRLFLALVFGGFVGLGIGSEIERIHASAVAEKETAFFASADGRKYYDCFARPVLNSAGAEKELCDLAEWQRLGIVRDEAMRVTSMDIVRRVF